MRLLPTILIVQILLLSAGAVASPQEATCKHAECVARRAREKRAEDRERYRARIPDAEHHFREGRELERRGHLDAAVEQLEIASELVPAEARYHLQLGRVLRKVGEPESAAVQLRWAHELGDSLVQQESEALLKALGARLQSRTGAVARPRTARPAGRKRPATGAASSLYERLGGEEGIRKVVDGLLVNVSKDPRINRMFAMTNLTDLRARLIEQIGQATGGPQTYVGQDMKAAHAGMGITNAQFDALVQDLVTAMAALGVAARERDELVAILGPLRGDIVEE